MDRRAQILATDPKVWDKVTRARAQEGPPRSAPRFWQPIEINSGRVLGVIR